MNLKKENGFYTDREYTVDECHALCQAKAECGAFFIANTKITHRMNKGSCLLYKKGCENDGNSKFDHYSMTDCLNTGNFSFSDLN